MNTKIREFNPTHKIKFYYSKGMAKIPV